jgi:hypothetical protein
MRKKIVIDGKQTNYSVTDDARIFNDITGRELKGTYKTNEYHSIQLVIEGKPKTYMFHRLVAEAFCDNPNGYTIVDHIDRDKHNDCASNLRWVSAKENALNRDFGKVRKNEKYTGDFSEEKWVPVYNHKDYMINSKGVIVNTKNRNIMALHDRHSYQRVFVDDKKYSLHILVWESFNNKSVPDGMQIDHIDGDKTNNSIDNLQLVTASENMKNAYSNGHQGQVGVKQYTLEGEYIKSYSSIREAANAVGANEAGLKDATNRHGTCAGYYWIRESDKTTIQEVLYGWIPEGYTLIKNYPTYCINKEGKIYGKRNKKFVSYKFRADGTPYVILSGNRINVDKLMP